MSGVKPPGEPFVIDVVSRTSRAIRGDVFSLTQVLDGGRRVFYRSLEANTVLLEHRTGAWVATPWGSKIVELSPDGTRGFSRKCDGAKSCFGTVSPTGDFAQTIRVAGPGEAKPLAWIGERAVLVDYQKNETLENDVLAVVSTIDLKTGAVTPGRRIPTDLGMIVSQDGRRLAWAERDRSQPKLVLAVAEIDLLATPRRYAMPFGIKPMCAFADADRRVVCVSGGGEEGSADSVDLASGAVVHLADRALYSPAVSPGGKFVAFSIMNGGVPRIAITPVDRSDVQLLLGPGAERQFADAWLTP